MSPKDYEYYDCVVKVHTNKRQGCGVVVLPHESGCLVITAYHVIQNQSIKIEHEGKIYKASLYKYNKEQDIAFVLVNTKLPIATMTFKKKRIYKALAVGYPSTYTDQLVWTKTTLTSSYAKVGKKVLRRGQSDVVRGGFSGGGVFNLQGELIGITQRTGAGYYYYLEIDRCLEALN